MRLSCALGAVLLITGVAVGADLGPQVGSQAPDFTLTDQAGKQRSLNQFLATGKTALVFYRSASW